MDKLEKEKRKEPKETTNLSHARQSVKLLNQLAAEKYIMGGK
tara:strand:- start:615 stop:740 length:126 start_codon:yes stop_codon:yes gene_type:complete